MCQYLSKNGLGFYKSCHQIQNIDLDDDKHGDGDDDAGRVEAELATAIAALRLDLIVVVAVHDVVVADLWQDGVDVDIVDGSEGIHLLK